MENFSYYLSKNPPASIMLWFLLGFIIGKTYEGLISPNISKYIIFLKNRESEVAFGATVIALIMLFITIIFDLLGVHQFMWYLLSISGLIVGILAFMPFSFTKKK